MMHKRLLSLLFALSLIFTLMIPVNAIESEDAEEAVEEEEIQIAVRELSISTAEEFLTFAEACRLDSYSQNLEVTLESDIDLQGTSFNGIPIFCGTFLGNAHTISGISITSDGSYRGLFRYLTEEALVRDLTVVGQINPTGTHNYVGAIAGSNAGSIDHCQFRGTLSGGDYVGGIAGINTVTGVITWCGVEGEIYGDHFVGGVTGENRGVVHKSINWAKVNTMPKQNTVNLSDITLDTLKNSESANTATDIGGIAGLSSGVIRNCDNRGDVGYQLMGYNIGGIAGTQSGYITESKNYNAIQGRKETGGIVGQMEPVTQIEFTQDTLQILREQLNSMSGVVSRVSGNAQSNAGKITGQIGLLQDQVQTAKDAVESLYSGDTFPDADALLAAQTTLTKTLRSMPSTMGSIASATQATVSGLSRDLSALSGHISAMGETLNNASENLGGTITDISDQDTPDLLTGKVENCVNYGSVFADLNVGGIAGAMAMENDLDFFEDLQQYGEQSLNFDSEVRAVILNCENSGTVTGNKQNAGGLVGWHSLGLLKDSTNTGKVDAENANHIGGACGTSTGFIRFVNTNCEVSGDAFVGGIAGSGTIVTDSLAHVKLIGAREKSGNILGWREESMTDVEDPIRDNYYLSVGDDCGAVDGISYAGVAEPMELDAFLAIRDLPDIFQTAKLHFQFVDGTVQTLAVTVGDPVDEADIPELPQKEGYSAKWKGLDDADLTSVLFDLQFEAEYTADCTTIQSTETWKDGRPMVLVEGVFTDDAEVTLRSLENAPILKEKESILEVWSIQCSEPAEKARLLLTDVYDIDGLKLYCRSAEGEWTETDAQLDGSYLVFSLPDKEVELAVVQTEANSIVWILCGCGAAVAMLAVILIIRKKRNSRKDIPVTDA